MVTVYVIFDITENRVIGVIDDFEKAVNFIKSKPEKNYRWKEFILNNLPFET